MNISEALLMQNIELGEKRFSEREIIDFAKKNDPLPFHLDLKTANKSIFKGLVCSGSQPFNYFYVNRWIPAFGDSVIAGLSVNNWNFIAPIYANDLVIGSCYIKEKKKTKENDYWVVKWNFEFTIREKIAQELTLSVLMVDAL